MATADVKTEEDRLAGAQRYAIGLLKAAGVDAPTGRVLAMTTSGTGKKFEGTVVGVVADKDNTGRDLFVILTTAGTEMKVPINNIKSVAQGGRRHQKTRKTRGRKTRTLRRKLRRS